MRRLLLILLAIAPLTACEYLSAGEDIEIIDPFEGASDAITDAGETISDVIEGEAEDDSFTGEVEEVPVVTADLIRSTDPEARTQLVQQSRIDPFAVLPIPLDPEPSVVPVVAAGNGGGSDAGAAAAATAAANANVPTPPPVRVQDQNDPLVSPSPIAALPRIPQPVIAPSILVSGIIQLGGEPYAIVSSGSEPERYVRVGDSLAGGSVRVKRIDTMAFEPQVILEENGIEVSRPVNSSGGAPDAADTVVPEEAPVVPVVSLPAASIQSRNSLMTSQRAALPSIENASSASASSGAPAGASPELSLPSSAPVSTLDALPASVSGGVPGSLLLLPPEDLPSQATLPDMWLSEGLRKA